MLLNEYSNLMYLHIDKHLLYFLIVLLLLKDTWIQIGNLINAHRGVGCVCVCGFAVFQLLTHKNTPLSDNDNKRYL